MNACTRRWCNRISSLEYLAGAERQSTDRERACPGDALFRQGLDASLAEARVWGTRDGVMGGLELERKCF